MKKIIPSINKFDIFTIFVSLRYEKFQIDKNFKFFEDINKFERIDIKNSSLTKISRD